MEFFDAQAPLGYAQLEAAICALRRRYGFLRVHTVGRTCFGRRLAALELGQGPVLLVHGAHHANEWITAALLLRFAGALCGAVETGEPLAGCDVRRALSRTRLWLVPMVNPDGVDLVTGALGPETLAYRQAQRLAQSQQEQPFPAGWKANLCGVDLNLNYPAGWACARRCKAQLGVDGPGPRDFAGERPLSERESAAMAALACRLRPRLSLSYHTQGREIYWQYCGCAPVAAERLGQALAAASGYRLAEPPAVSGHGGFKDWMLLRFGGFSYTVEAGLGENPLPLSQLPELWAENLPLLLLALERTPELPAACAKNIFSS